MERWEILPKVKKFMYLEGSFILDKVVVKTSVDEAILKVFNTVLDQVECCDEGSNLELQEVELEEEEYKIEITQNGISIQYGNRKGLFYAIITLKQLQKQFGSSLHCMKIWDYPVLLSW